jgi:hypothetical protein
MKQKADGKSEPIQGQGLPATADRQVQTLKPESGADTELSCQTAARIPRAKARAILAKFLPGLTLRLRSGQEARASTLKPFCKSRG